MKRLNSCSLAAAVVSLLVADAYALQGWICKGTGSMNSIANWSAKVVPTTDQSSSNSAWCFWWAKDFPTVMNKEGTEIADWLNTLGICAFVLKYRVPGNPDGAFCDAQRAISTIRARASEFAVDSKRVGMIGFSAGGNLAARTSADGRRFYSPVDGLDDSPCRPDFSLLIYPWALVPGKDSEKDLPLVLRPEFPVDGSTPMAFIVQSEDDCFHVENSLAYAAALKRAGVPFELHVYPDGVHGYGLRNRFAAVSAWSRLAEQWLRRNVLVP